MKITSQLQNQRHWLKKGSGALLFFIAMGLCLTGCTPIYPAYKVSYSDPRVCFCGDTFPFACHIEIRDFSFDFTLSKQDAPGVFKFEGHAMLKEEKNYNYLQIQGKTNRFHLYLLKDGYFFDRVRLKICTDEYRGVLPLQAIFKPKKGFDAVTIEFSVQKDEMVG